MGLCPSRNQNISKNQKTASFEAEVAPVAPVRDEKKLRGTAQPFVPTATAPKEAWELFLDAKQSQRYKAPRSKSPGGFARRADGSYTSGYRQLLDPKVKKAPWAKESKRTMNVSQSWREAFGENTSPEKKKKLSTLKKKILAERSEQEEDPLLLKFEEHCEKARMQAQTAVVPSEPVARCVDDVRTARARLVPFGLSDRHYLSESEDTGKSQRHCSSTCVPAREYVTSKITPALEEAVTNTLFHLRKLKLQEATMGLKTHRYTVGFREVTRMMAQGRGKALLVAPDVERTSGALEAKIASLVQACENNSIPVIYALSRRQLGQAIQKNMVISVLGIQETKGAEVHFERLVAAAQEAAECK